MCSRAREWAGVRRLTAHGALWAGRRSLRRYLAERMASRISICGGDRRRNVPVYAHVEELPYVTGCTPTIPLPDPTVGGGLMARMASAYPRETRRSGGPRPPTRRGRVGPGHAGMALDPYAWTYRRARLAVSRRRPRADRRRRVLHHEVRSLSLPSRHSGQSCTARRRISRPIGMRRASRSVELAALEPAFIAPGHGQPMAGAETARALHELADRFDEVARPGQGRYIEHPRRA